VLLEKWVVKKDGVISSVCGQLGYNGCFQGTICPNYICMISANDLAYSFINTGFS
jgi:hypothetical protein